MRKTEQTDGRTKCNRNRNTMKCCAAPGINRAVVPTRPFTIKGGLVKIDFNEAAHAYTIDGRPVPSVTQVLSEMLGDPTNGWGEQYHLDRGSAAHELYAMMARGEDLRLYDYDQRLAGHVAAWRAWNAAERPKFEAIEKPVAHAHYGYAGTPDAVCIIGGVTTMIDYKQLAGKRDLLQTAAYVLAYEDMTGSRVKAIQSLQIDGDGWRYGPGASGCNLVVAKQNWLGVLRAWQIKQEVAK